MADQTHSTRRRGFLQRSISLRLALILLGIAIVGGLILWATADLDCRRTVRENTVQSAGNLAASVALFSTDDVIDRDWNTLQQRADELVRQRPFVYVAIVDLRGRSVVHTDRGELNEEFRSRRYGRDIVEAHAPVMRGTRQIATARVGLRVR